VDKPTNLKQGIPGFKERCNIPDLFMSGGESLTSLVHNKDIYLLFTLTTFHAASGEVFVGKVFQRTRNPTLATIDGAVHATVVTRWDVGGTASSGCTRSLGVSTRASSSSSRMHSTPLFVRLGAIASRHTIEGLETHVSQLAATCTLETALQKIKEFKMLMDGSGDLNTERAPHAKRIELFISMFDSWPQVREHLRVRKVGVAWTSQLPYESDALRYKKLVQHIVTFLKHIANREECRKRKAQVTFYDVAYPFHSRRFVTVHVYMQTISIEGLPANKKVPRGGQE
jgi:hypothetical protein